MVASKARLAAALALLLVAGTAGAGAAGEAPPTLDSVLNNSDRAAAASKATGEIPQVRFNALKEAALAYGVQSGLARRSYEISAMLGEQKQMLDSIYNFGAMVLDKNVMPPVLSESQNSLNQPDADTIRVADATYRIERQARFVTVPATWRDYLQRDAQGSAAMPAGVLLPKSDAERGVWQQLVAQGWKIGVQQADDIFAQSLSRLERDYKGMVLYRSLLAKGMIGRPYVAEANLGVTGDGNAINVNDRILRITAKPKLETNAAVWNPLVTPK